METASPYEWIPALMAPEKFVPREVFDVWESQVRRYVRRLPSSYQADAVINLLTREACNLLVTLRRRLAEPKTTFEQREEFYMRQQRLEESLMD
ncbi:unnamed protein product [Echinostoma caproni]|uniref:Integrase n=1 Tax=Echinostoma caproni TaxID=27848 RepID=A0A183B880_9TREM|nr:unnamed protein product [Echinostoma caproni]